MSFHLVIVKADDLDRVVTHHHTVMGLTRLREADVRNEIAQSTDEGLILSLEVPLDYHCLLTR